MNQYKIKTYGCEELNKMIQDELFRLGYEWDTRGKDYDHLNRKYLYTNENMTLDWGMSDITFNDDPNIEITLDDLRSMGTNIVKLDEEYIATIFEDGNVEVGCTEFSRENIEEFIVNYLCVTSMGGSK